MVVWVRVCGGIVLLSAECWSCCGSACVRVVVAYDDLEDLRL
jgi:hypothetical protein